MAIHTLEIRTLEIAIHIDDDTGGQYHIPESRDIMDGGSNIKGRDDGGGDDKDKRGSGGGGMVGGGALVLHTIETGARPL